jgi:hypothetical protein
VHLHRVGVRPGQRLARRAELGIDVSGVDEHLLRARRQLLQVIVERVEAREGRGLPPHLQHVGGLDRLPFLVRDDTDVVVFRDDLDETLRLQPRETVDPEEGRVERRRPHDPALEHAGDLDVLGVGEEAEDLRRDVHAGHGGADDPVLGEGLRRRLAGRGPHELLAADELGVGDGALGVASDGHHALRDLEARDGSAELRCGHRKERSARLGARLTNAAFPVLRPKRVAAGAVSLLDRTPGVRDHELDRVEWDVELVGGDLQRCGADALAELLLAGEDRRRAVAGDREPRVELARVDVGRSDREGRGRRPGLACDAAEQREADDERPGSLQELITVEGPRLVGWRDSHRASFHAAMTFAARWIAATMR